MEIPGNPLESLGNLRRAAGDFLVTAGDFYGVTFPVTTARVTMALGDAGNPVSASVVRFHAYRYAYRGA